MNYSAMDVYKEAPVFENESFLLRLLQRQDAEDLLKVYSDEKSVPLFNSDNCNGDTFYYGTLERVHKAIDMWEMSYRHRYFVRWSIVDKRENAVIGTIELFHRDAEDYFHNCGLLRLDLRSDYETGSDITEILNLIVPVIYDLFYCDKIATKVVSIATERAKALKQMGFMPSDEKVRGHDGSEYGDYFVKFRNK